MRILIALQVLAAALLAILPARAEPIRTERRLLAPFLMFGVDYRNKGPDPGIFSAAWINISEHPLVFARSQDRATMTITPIDDCRYRIETHYSPGSDGSAPSYPDRNAIFDFRAMVGPHLYASSLGSYWLRGRGYYDCPVDADGKTMSEYCLGVPKDDKDEFLIELNGGADDDAIVNVYRYFFQNVCRVPGVQMP